MEIVVQNAIRRRQLTAVFFLVLLTGLGSAISYYFVNQSYVFYRQAKQLLDHGQSEAALELLEKAMAHGVNVPQVGFEAAETALRLDRVDKATMLLFTALDAAQTPMPGDVGRAAGLFDQYGYPTQALALYERYGSRMELGEEQLLHYAELLRRAYQYEKALEIYRRMLAAQPDALHAGLGMAETLGWLSRYDEALALCKQLIAAHPESRNARLLYARVLSWRGDFELAIEQYRMILGETP